MRVRPFDEHFPWKHRFPRHGLRGNTLLVAAHATFGHASVFNRKPRVPQALGRIQTFGSFCELSVCFRFPCTHRFWGKVYAESHFRFRRPVRLLKFKSGKGRGTACPRGVLAHIVLGPRAPNGTAHRLSAPLCVARCGAAGLRGAFCRGRAARRGAACRCGSRRVAARFAASRFAALRFASSRRCQI